MWGEAEGKRKKEGKEREKGEGKRNFPHSCLSSRCNRMKQATC
jgi:hypothetical protein